MWKLNWEWQAYQNSVDYSPITLSALFRIGINFYLHLPQLRPERFGWMKDLMVVLDANIGYVHELQKYSMTKINSVECRNSCCPGL